MMKKLLTVRDVLRLYNHNPNLPSTFSQPFGHGLIALDTHDNDPKLASFHYTFPPNQRNIQDTVHGGALTSMIDIATTIAILRMTPHRTISISISTEFLTVIKAGEPVEVATQITKIGKNVVFSECRIYTNINQKKKLACKGQHIKSIAAEDWTFMKDAHKEHL